MTDQTIDVVERLRLLQSGAAWQCSETAATLEDAADEIEWLRAGLAAIAKDSEDQDTRAYAKFLLTQGDAATETLIERRGPAHWIQITDKATGLKVEWQGRSLTPRRCELLLEKLGKLVWKKKEGLRDDA